MLQSPLSRPGDYLGFLRRLETYNTKYEKIGVEPLSRYSEDAFLLARKLALGSAAYARLVRRRPDIRLQGGDPLASAAWLDGELAPALARIGLFLFPSYSFYPTGAKLTLTTACNYLCRHCYQEGSRRGGAVAPEHVEQFLDKLDAAGIRKFSISGGEPFLYPDLVFDTVARARAHGSTVHTIITNGFWCGDDGTALDHLGRLKAAGFTGSISISIGIGHEPYHLPGSFRDLKAHSRKVFGRNIFYFALEEISYARFLERRRSLTETLGTYYFKPMLIAQVGGGKAYRKAILSEYPVADVMGRCEGLGIHMMPDGRMTFCMGMGSLLDEFLIGEVGEGSAIKEMMGRKEKLISLVARYKGQEMLDALVREGKLKNPSRFPVLCDLCVHLARNRRLLDFLHEKMVARA